MKYLCSDKIARIISTLFIPPVFTVYILTFLALRLETSNSKIFISISIAVLFGFIFPVGLFIYFRKKGKIIDIDASVKEERTLPFIISIFFYLSGFIILLYFKINLISTGFWFCYISTTFVVIIINRFWKISIHATGASGAFAAIFFTIGIHSLYFLVILFLVGWSRIQLKCHNLAQVAAGSLLGFGLTYLQMYLIYNKF